MVVRFVSIKSYFGYIIIPRIGFLIWPGISDRNIIAIIPMAIIVWGDKRRNGTGNIKKPFRMPILYGGAWGMLLGWSRIKLIHTIKEAIEMERKMAPRPLRPIADKKACIPK